MLEENIKIVNELNDEEDKNRKQEEESQQKSMPNFNPNSMMSNIGNMTNNLGNFKP